MSKAGYVIQVGHESPQKVIVSIPNKEGTPGVEQREVFNEVGVHMLINRCRVWARRVTNDGKTGKDKEGKDIPLEATDPQYRGKLEFLDWGDDKLGAQQIEVRYLKQSSSLDVDFQDWVQKIRLDPNGEDGHVYLQFTSGQNKYDYKKEALLIQFLQIHSQNQNSKSKNPEPQIKGYLFKEVTDDMTSSTAVKQMESEFTAGNFVMTLSNDVQQLRNLFEIFTGYGVTFGDVNHLSVDTDIYTSLLAYSKVDGAGFTSNVDRYKKDLSDYFVKAESWKALDLTKNGFIALLVDNKNEVIYEGAEGKGRDMLDWVMHNFLKQDVYEKTKRLKIICEQTFK